MMDNGMSRRAVLRGGLCGAAGLMLGDRLALPAWAAPPAAKAKAVIQIWMWGGPSHLDTFDPKPKAGSAYCGPLDKPIGTNVDGIQVGQMLPGNDEDVNRSLRVDVAKRQDFVVAENLIAGNITGDDFAEKTLSHGTPLVRIIQRTAAVCPRTGRL